MKATLRRIFTALFVVALAGFLALAVIMVMLQIVGSIVALPQLVTWASEVLLRPSIVAAVVAGMCGFVVMYTVPSEELHGSPG
ncbi:hypothetical protein [Nesterenkonia aerolata]|uniref:Uncharacterized protein n=1 Tax=Nesterenkonia aerolata TaxID=3074079 RepID=A0ABU2DS46_9MICC|nr:hypothetical protein [Nesterenkonia sp. LY-0111]MDR8019318.1 hypothetical protein [Nesterenkonia sp. LY-0111]